MQTVSSRPAEPDLRIVIPDDRKELLVDREVIFESVRYLRSEGMDEDEIVHCLVHHFYVDLDLLHEAFQHH